MEDEPLLKTRKQVVDKIQNNGSINEVETANGDLFPEIVDEKEHYRGKVCLWKYFINHINNTYPSSANARRLLTNKCWFDSSSRSLNSFIPTVFRHLLSVFRYFSITSYSYLGQPSAVLGHLCDISVSTSFDRSELYVLKNATFRSTMSYHSALSVCIFSPNAILPCEQ